MESQNENPCLGAMPSTKQTKPGCYIRVLKTRQQDQNGVAYAKVHIAKWRLNLFTVLALPDIESQTNQSGIT